MFYLKIDFPFSINVSRETFLFWLLLVPLVVFSAFSSFSAFSYFSSFSAFNSFSYFSSFSAFSFFIRFYSIFRYVGEMLFEGTEVRGGLSPGQTGQHSGELTANYD